MTGSRDNNFDVLRLAAAALVLVSHSFPLTGRHDPVEPHSLGTVGVEIFFAISGFLVTRSWLSDPSIGRYLGKRIRRIFPGLICAVAVGGLVIGGAFTSASAGRFFASGGVWAYIVSNLILFPLYSVPGVFAGNPTHALNGSLWTLPVEFRSYLFLGMLGLGGLVSRRPIAAAAVGLFVANAAFHLSPSMRLVSMFAAGSLLYLLQDRIVLRGHVALLLLAGWLALFETRYATAAGMVAIPYLACWFAYRSPRRLRALTRHGDVSYGFYVYAFPVQQALVATLGVVRPLVLAAAAIPIVWLLGFASWRLVELPVLRRRPLQLGQDPSGEPRVAAGGEKIEGLVQVDLV